MYEPNGTILIDSIAEPAPSGDGAAGDTNANPDLGRRRTQSLQKHFRDTPIESDKLSESFWARIQANMKAWSVDAPDLDNLTLEGTSIPPGLDHALCPNLSAWVPDPDGPQEPTGNHSLLPNSQADTASPLANPSSVFVSPSRNPSIVTAGRLQRPFIEGRKTRWS